MSDSLAPTPNFFGKLSHAWDAFRGRSNTNLNDFKIPTFVEYGPMYSTRGEGVLLRLPNGDSFISSIYSRLANDFAEADFRHVRVDEDGETYLETIKSSLNGCLELIANRDQVSRAFLIDIALTMFEKGVVAIVPVETTEDPRFSDSWDIKQLRVGYVTAWYPMHVRVNVYNQDTGQREDVTLPKRMVALAENPFYSVMNTRNSILQRLLRKLAIMDILDEKLSTGKLNILLQMPYVAKSDARKGQAQKRIAEIEQQLENSPHGIAYTDGTEKITQLNRPADNDMLGQVKWLTEMLHGQLGLTADIMDGTADESVMLNYYYRTIGPIWDVVAQAMRAKFLSKTARTQGQTILYFRDLFKAVPMKDMAEIADKFSRNAVMTSNEIRSKMGLKPIKDPGADQLVNKNMPIDKTPGGTAPEEQEPAVEEDLEE